jgi:hypothetical protein
VRLILVGTALVVAVALGLPALAQHEPKQEKSKPEKPDAKPPQQKKESKTKTEAKEKLVPAGQAVGRIVKVPGADRLLGVRGLGNGGGKAVDFLVHDDVKVRLAQLPAQFDDKGRPKRYSTKELNELRGPDKKLPGFTASLEDLRVGQTVEIALVRKAGKLKLAKGEEIPDEYKPQVNLILIRIQPPEN